MKSLYKMYWESIKSGERVYTEQIAIVKAKVLEIADAELESGAIEQKDYDKWLGIEVPS